MVGLCTGIPVDTFAFFKRGMDAAISPRTTIFRAWITIIAGGLIRASIAVIVYAVANLRRGHCGIACIQAVLTTNAHSAAGTVFILDFTWRSQA